MAYTIQNVNDTKRGTLQKVDKNAQITKCRMLQWIRPRSYNM